MPTADRLISRKPPRLSEISSRPRRTPGLLAVHPTWTVQLAPGASEAEQPLLTMLKSAAPALIALVTLVAAAPLLVTRIGTGRTGTPG